VPIDVYADALDRHGTAAETEIGARIRVTDAGALPAVLAECSFVLTEPSKHVVVRESRCGRHGSQG
jgi:hypothetical protein